MCWLRAPANAGPWGVRGRGSRFRVRGVGGQRPHHLLGGLMQNRLAYLKATQPLYGLHRSAGPDQN